MNTVLGEQQREEHKKSFHIIKTKLQFHWNCVFAFETTLTLAVPRKIWMQLQLLCMCATNVNSINCE